MMAANSKTTGTLKRKAMARSRPERKYFDFDNKRKTAMVVGIIIKISPLAILPSVRGIQERMAKRKVEKRRREDFLKSFLEIR